MKIYKRRIFDDILKDALEAKGAVLIQGPKWCGKTTTAEQMAQSVLYMSDPEKIEQIVNDLIEPEVWTNFSHLLIQHGRKVCHAGNAACGDCVLNEICPKCGVK